MQNCSLVLMCADLLDLFSKCQCWDVGDPKPFKTNNVSVRCTRSFVKRLPVNNLNVLSLNRQRQ